MNLASRLGLSFSIVGGLAAAAGCVDTSQAVTPWNSWKTLRLEAHSVPLLSGEVEMRLAESEEDLVFETQTEARFLGVRIAESRTASRLDPRSGLPRSYVSLSRKRGRRYTFGKASYTVERLQPPEDDTMPHERWDVSDRQELAYPTDQAGAPVAVYDYYGMLMHLRRTDLQDVGDEVTLYVATSGGAFPYRILVAEVRESERSVRDLSDDSERSMALRELRLRVIPADPDNADEGFLKMEGETELWVEADSKTVLSLGGKVRKVPGRVELVLVGMG